MIGAVDEKTLPLTFPVSKKVEGTPARDEELREEFTDTKLDKEDNVAAESEQSTKKTNEELFQTTLESTKELTLDEQKAAIYTLQLFALGGQYEVNEYLERARDYAISKGIDIFEVLRPQGEYYNQFVTFLRGDLEERAQSQDFESLHAEADKPDSNA